MNKANEHIDDLQFKLSQEYISAELTCLVYENRISKSFTNLLTLIELIPCEQPHSPEFGTDQFPNLVREAIDDYSNLFFIRIISTINEAVAIYQNCQDKISISYNKKKIDLLCLGSLVEEPPNGSPLLISNEETTYGTILPKQNTPFRVWAKINVDKTWATILTAKHLSKISTLTLSYLQKDIADLPEHWGNVYMFGCNPIIRRISSQLVTDGSKMLIEFYERKGKSVLGSRLILEEFRAGNPGFFIEKTITSIREIIDLPYKPNMISIKLLTSNGSLLFQTKGTYLQAVHVDMDIGGKTVNYSLQTAKGIREISVNKFSSERSVIIGNNTSGASSFLKEQALARRPRELEKAGEFFFFPKSEDSRQNARQIVQEILKTARNRCFILDPYFGYEDLEYIFHIENISASIRVISSAQYLRGDTNPPVKRKCNIYTLIMERFNVLFRKKTSDNEVKFAHHLNSGILQLNGELPEQKIHCKVLMGKSSPLHDRYIIVDDKVYLLGSSLNEFGNRTTTIIKVPDPIEMINLAEKWWQDTNVPTLEAYIKSIDNDSQS